MAGLIEEAGKDTEKARVAVDELRKASGYISARKRQVGDTRSGKNG